MDHAGRVALSALPRRGREARQADETDLWPDVAPQTAGTATSELINVYCGATDVPAELWRGLLERAEKEIDLLGSALLHLFEAPGFVAPLDTRRRVRITLADPHSAMVAERDEELRLGGALPTGS